MVSTRQTGAYQTACDHNQQWQRTMNAIIYKNTVQVSFSLSLLRLFTLALCCGQHGEAVTLSIQSSAGPFHSAQGYPAIHPFTAIMPDESPAAASSLPTSQF